MFKEVVFFAVAQTFGTYWVLQAFRGWSSVQRKNVSVSFHTGGVGNPLKWRGVNEYEAATKGMLDMLRNGVPETRYYLGLAVMLDCTKLAPVCRYKKYEHTGLHSPILEAVLKDPVWPGTVASFMRAWVDACVHPDRTLVVLDCCKRGKKGCAGVVAMLRMLTITMGAQPKPEPVTHTSQTCWKKHTCGVAGCAANARGTYDDNSPEEVLQHVWRSAQRALDAQAKK